MTMNAGIVRSEGVDQGQREIHCPYPGPNSQPFSYSGYTAGCLGRAQVAAGSLSVILQGLGLAVDSVNHKAAPGIWCGILVGIFLRTPAPPTQLK